jgi:hypothetical protein
MISSASLEMPSYSFLGKRLARCADTRTDRAYSTLNTRELFQDLPPFPSPLFQLVLERFLRDLFLLLRLRFGDLGWWWSGFGNVLRDRDGVARLGKRG